MAPNQFATEEQPRFDDQLKIQVVRFTVLCRVSTVSIVVSTAFSIVVSTFVRTVVSTVRSKISCGLVRV